MLLRSPRNDSLRPASSQEPDGWRARSAGGDSCPPLPSGSPGGKSDARAARPSFSRDDRAPFPRLPGQEVCGVAEPPTLRSGAVKSRSVEERRAAAGLAQPKEPLLRPASALPGAPSSPGPGWRRGGRGTGAPQPKQKAGQLRRRHHGQRRRRQPAPSRLNGFPGRKPLPPPPAPRARQFQVRAVPASRFPATRVQGKSRRLRSHDPRRSRAQRPFCFEGASGSGMQPCLPQASRPPGSEEGRMCLGGARTRVRSVVGP